MISLKRFRHGVLMPLALTALVFSQIPLAAAFVLALPNADSEHEVVTAFDGGAVHLSLRHASVPDRPHRHHGCERLLFGESGSEHPDHEFLAGSSEEISEPESGPEEGLEGSGAVSPTTAVCPGIECRAGFAVIAGGLSVPPTMPALWRRGVVMRH